MNIDFNSIIEREKEVWVNTIENKRVLIPIYPLTKQEVTYLNHTGYKFKMIESDDETRYYYYIGNTPRQKNKLKLRRE